MFYYIDPGTGSMLFTVLIGLITAGVYALRSFFIRLRFTLSGGKQDKSANSIPFVIFSDSKRYWNVFEPICDEFEKRKTSIVYMTASSDDPAFEKEYEFVKCQFIGEGNRAFAKLNMLRADVVLSTTPGLDVYQWKRSKDVKYYVHIPHAVSDITLYRMFGIDYYDAILVPGKYQIDQIRQLEEKRNLPAKELATVGLTYFDEMKKRLDNTAKYVDDKITVLLAPSWGPSSILNKYGDKAIDALIATGYNIVIRPHPQSYTSEKELIETLQKKYPDSEQLSWNRDNDNFDILNRSSILISDFSGVIFDFALIFDKPIIYADTSFDKAPYDACWLEDELWTFDVLPKIGAQLKESDFDDLKKTIDDCLSSEMYQNGRDEAREQTWCNIGSAALTITDYLIEKQKELNAKEE